MKTPKILKEISTHKAVLVNASTINIYVKGFECGKPIDEDYLRFEDEFLYSISADNEDDLFAIFERYEEDNRINHREAKIEFSSYTEKELKSLRK